ncbi:hypothetical protein B0H14DRAFT_2823388 [Mycena olivaceomarginata]|nr:hypothetical protein B0H14DRAFT_2823388 [Mycena olivaceomarginata]
MLEQTRVQLLKASIYFLRRLLADNLNGPIGERNRVSTAHRTANRDAVEGVAMVLVGEGGTAALLREELDIASGRSSLGSGGHGGGEGRVQREVGNRAGEFWDADGLEKRAGGAVSWNGAVRSRASKRATPDLNYFSSSGSLTRHCSRTASGLSGQSRAKHGCESDDLALRQGEHLGD